jgi:hypothetical protein
MAVQAQQQTVALGDIVIYSSAGDVVPRGEYPAVVLGVRGPRQVDLVAIYEHGMTPARLGVRYVAPHDDSAEARQIARFGSWHFKGE